MSAALPTREPRHDAGLRFLLQVLDRWGVRALVAALACVLLALFAIVAIAQLAPGVRDASGLVQTVTAANLVQALQSQNGGRWPAPEAAPPPGLPDRTPAQIASAAEPAIAPSQASPATIDGADLPLVRLTGLRVALAIDSLVLVPASLCALLLGVFLVVRRSWNEDDFQPRGALLSAKELGLHLLCVVPVAAASFDIAGDGILIRACEEAASYVLSDDVVRDLALATACKWGLTGLAALLLALLTLRARGALVDDERPAEVRPGAESVEEDERRAGERLVDEAHQREANQRAIAWFLSLVGGFAAAGAGATAVVQSWQALHEGVALASNIGWLETLYLGAQGTGLAFLMRSRRR